MDESPFSVIPRPFSLVGLMGQYVNIRGLGKKTTTTLLGTYDCLANLYLDHKS